MHVRAGKLKYRITIQRNSPTRDSFGGTSDSWSTYATRWADIRPQTAGSQERFDGAEFHGRAMYEFEIRYTSGITSAMRISWNSRTFDVQTAHGTKLAGRNTIIVAMERI